MRMFYLSNWLSTYCSRIRCVFDRLIIYSFSLQKVIVRIDYSDLILVSDLLGCINNRLVNFDTTEVVNKVKLIDQVIINLVFVYFFQICGESFRYELVVFTQHTH